MKKGLKLLLGLIGLIGLLLVLLVIFISPIAKYLIEKHSVEYTGRQIRMDRLRINLFNGHMTASGVRIYEPDGKTEFLTCKKLSTNIIVYKMVWSSKYDITEMKLEKPMLRIVQDGDHFNYDDLVKRFLSDTTPAKPGEKPVEFWVRNISADSAKIIYETRRPAAKLTIVNADLSLPLVAWNDPVYRVHGVMDIASGGHLAGDMVLNADTYQYTVSADMRQLNIGWMYPYLHDYMKVKTLDGLVSCKMHLSGNFNHPTAVAASGDISAEKFSIVDELNERLTAVDQLTIKIDTLNTTKNMFNFSLINISRPFLRLSMYDNGFNYERIMTTPYDAKGDTASVRYANIFLMMAGYIQDIVKEYDVNNYKINQLRITGGQCIFSDFTHGDKFRYVLDSLDMGSNRINSNNPQLVFDVKGRLNTSGKMKGVMKVDPKNYRDIDIDAQVTGLLMSDFNPYSKYYVATPFVDGKISYVNRTIIISNQLDSKNVLDVYKLTAGKKIKNVSTAINLPVRLAVSLLKDVHGNIHIDIPVKGSLDDPEFKWGKVVWSVIKNLCVKIVSAPFKLLANMFGGKENDYKEIYFDYVQAGVQNDQKRALDQLAKVAANKPDLKIELVQVTNREDEAEVLALMEMKRQYLKLPADIEPGPELKKRTDSLRNTDSVFLRFLNTRLGTNNHPLQSVEEKCVLILGKDVLAGKVNASMERRNRLVSNYFNIDKQLPPDRFHIINARDSLQLQKSEPPKYLINVALKEDQSASSSQQ
jgi:hypothetical protein